MSPKSGVEVKIEDLVPRIIFALDDVRMVHGIPNGLLKVCALQAEQVHFSFLEYFESDFFLTFEISSLFDESLSAMSDRFYHLKSILEIACRLEFRNSMTEGVWIHPKKHVSEPRIVKSHLFEVTSYEIGLAYDFVEDSQRR